MSKDWNFCSKFWMKFSTDFYDRVFIYILQFTTRVAIRMIDIRNEPTKVAYVLEHVALVNL